jgi:hypothetical protein
VPASIRSDYENCRLRKWFSRLADMQRKHRDPWGLAETKDGLKIETARSELRCRLTLNGRRVACRHKCDVLVLALNALVRKSHHTATARFTTLVRCVTTIAIARTWPRACLLFQRVLVVERNQRIGRPHRSLDVLTIRSHLSTSDIAGGSEITVVITTMRQGGPPRDVQASQPQQRSVLARLPHKVCLFQPHLVGDEAPRQCNAVSEAAKRRPGGFQTAV